MRVTILNGPEVLLRDLKEGESFILPGTNRNDPTVYYKQRERGALNADGNGNCYVFNEDKRVIPVKVESLTVSMRK